MRNRVLGASIAAVALALPMAALADVSKTVALASGQNYSFDTGTISASGGDIAFTGTAITFVGNAAGDSLNLLGISYFGFLPEQSLPQDSYTSSPITGGELAVDEVFAVRTNGGHYVKVEIYGLSGSSIQIMYAAYGVTGTSNNPLVTQITDAATYSSNTIAQGSVFVLKGIDLSGPGFAQSGFPLSTTFAGVTIVMLPESPGATFAFAYVLNAYNQGGVNQVAAVLPSSVTPGTYNVGVLYAGGETAPPPTVTYQIDVVAQRPGLITQDSTGSGLVVAQNYISATQLDVNRFTTGSVNGSTISPAHPGQTLIAWALGLGLAPTDGNVASPGYNFEANGQNIQAIVGGVSIAPTYAGPAPGEAGVDQINFTLPANVQTGCTVPFQISENGTLSQVTFISIAPSAAATACVQPGFTTEQLQALDNGAPAGYAAGFAISQSFSPSSTGASSTSSGINGDFVQYSGFELATVGLLLPVLEGGLYATPQPACTVSSSTQGPPLLGPGTLLDAGKVTLTGPSDSNLNGTPIPEANTEYGLTLASISAGTYTITGSGGSGVGPFTVSLNISPLVIAGGLPSVVNRSAGLTISWTGGNPTDAVAIDGLAQLPSSPINPNGPPTGAQFVCYTTASAKTFTVPPSILNQLPAVAAGAGPTFLTVTSSNTTFFAAPLTAGGSITNAGFTGLFVYNANPSYQ